MIQAQTKYTLIPEYIHSKIIIDYDESIDKTAKKIISFIASEYITIKFENSIMIYTHNLSFQNSSKYRKSDKIFWRDQILMLPYLIVDKVDQSFQNDNNINLKNRYLDAMIKEGISNHEHIDKELEFSQRDGYRSIILKKIEHIEAIGETECTLI